MALNAWQLITRVIPGKPFGTGADGALTISASATQTQTKATASGSATSTSLTAGSSSFTNGDLVMIHQSRGTGAGQWEINKVASGGGSTSLTMSTALYYTYGTGAQIIKIPQYTDVTVNSSQTWSAPAWDGSTGGFLIFAAKGTVTISGTLNGASLGYRGGAQPGETSGTANGFRGEGTSGDNGTRQTGSNGNGAGGGSTVASNGYYGAGGGGGSYGSAGTDGERINTDATFGSAGSTVGDTNLASMTFGGAGGSGGSDWEANTATAYGGAGGNGGGAIVIFGKTFASPNSLTTRGSDGYNAEYAPDGGAASNPHGGGGGAGAGGSILICAYDVNVGTDKLTTIGGTFGESSRSEANAGGNGGKGRIAVYYGLSLTGSISSSLYGTYTNAQDTSLKEAAGGGWFMFM